MDTIDVSAHIDRINETLLEKKMTRQQLADVTGIPKSTIDRILSHRTPNPLWDNMCKMEKAVGISYDAPLIAMPELTGDSKIDLFATLQHQIAQQRHDFESRINAQHRDYRMNIAYLKRTNAILRVTVALLIAAIVTVLIIDAANGNIGYIRYSRPEVDTATGFSRLVAWIKKALGL